MKFLWKRNACFDHGQADFHPDSRLWKYGLLRVHEGFQVYIGFGLYVYTSTCVYTYIYMYIFVSLSIGCRLLFRASGSGLPTGASEGLGAEDGNYDFCLPGKAPVRFAGAC